MIKYITLIAFVSACAQVGGPQPEPFECEEPVVCEEPNRCEDWRPPECPLPEQCQECETCAECPTPEQCPSPPECPAPQKFDPCSCVDFAEKHAVTEEEEACLGAMIDNHGLCGKYQLRVWCPDPANLDKVKPLNAWVKGCNLTQTQPDR